MRRPIQITLAVLTVCYLCLIFYVSSIPGLKVPIRSVRHSDKIAHFAEYFVLGTLITVGLLSFGHKRRYPTMTVVFCCLFAIGDEYHQSFVPNRHASLSDIIADVCGATAAAVSCYLLWPKLVALYHAKFKAEANSNKLSSNP